MTIARPTQSLLFAALLTSALLALPGRNASAQQISDVYKRQQQLQARELPPYHYLASHVEANKVKDCLPQIDADCVDFHGPPPVLLSLIHI